MSSILKQSEQSKIYPKSIWKEEQCGCTLFAAFQSKIIIENYNSVGGGIHEEGKINFGPTLTFIFLILGQPKR